MIIDKQLIIQYSVFLGNLASFKELFPPAEEPSPENLIKMLMCSESPDEDCFFSSCPVCEAKVNSFEEKLKSILEAENIENLEFSQWAFTDGKQKDFYVMNASKFCSEVMKSMVAFISKKQVYLPVKEESSRLYHTYPNGFC